MAFTIRPAAERDVAKIVELDRVLTGVEKTAYWHERFENYGRSGRRDLFLVAGDDGDGFFGFILGEVRAWEFGSPPCGWIFAVGVDPDQRLEGVGTALFEAICAAFRTANVSKVRTMLARRDHSLLMSFFRSQGMMAGPFAQLEKDLDE
jgi:GNAT superfamily N-acetyltransferase